MKEAISGAVLVGGKSRRMGRDKAMLSFHGSPLVARVVETIRPITTEVLLVGQELARFAWMSGVRMCQDIIPGVGPLAGIYSALRDASNSQSLIVACDMPFLNPRLLAFLCQTANGWDAVVPSIGGRLQPLHAVYARSCLPVIEELLIHGQHCPLDLFPQVRTRYVTEEELEAYDPGLLSFLNVNTPADWEKALRLGRVPASSPASAVSAHTRVEI